MKTSNRIVLTLVLAALSSAVLAEWIEIEKYEDNTRVYVDQASARRSGDTAQLVHLVRWGEAQVEAGHPPYLSTLVRSSYDCLGQREKYLGSTSYAGHMGGGARVVSDDNEAQGWDPISESSMEEKLWKIACGAN